MEISDFANEEIVGVFLVLLIAACLIGGAIYLANDTYTAKLTVITIDWQRNKDIEEFRAVYMDTYESSMPSDAYNISRYSSTSCSGSGSKRKCSTSYYARYWVNRWVFAYALTTTGKRNDERVYADFTPSGSDGILGSLRQGALHEWLWVHFNAGDHAPIDYNAPSAESWRSFVEGDKYTVKINRFEQVWWDTLSLVKADNR